VSPACPSQGSQAVPRVNHDSCWIGPDLPIRPRELHRAKARHDLLHKPTGGTRTALGRWPHSQLVGQLADLRRRVAPVATERL
jgi:hypothetical protein